MNYKPTSRLRLTYLRVVAAVSESQKEAAYQCQGNAVDNGAQLAMAESGDGGIVGDVMCLPGFDIRWRRAHIRRCVVW